jgi:hypothetical protein
MFNKSIRGNAIETVPINQIFELQQRVAKLETDLQERLVKSLNKLEQTTQPPPLPLTPQPAVPQKSLYERFKFWGGKTLKKRRFLKK